jgi:hypothetical protein
VSAVRTEVTLDAGIDQRHYDEADAGLAGAGQRFMAPGEYRASTTSSRQHYPDGFLQRQHPEWWALYRLSALRPSRQAVRIPKAARRRCEIRQNPFPEIVITVAECRFN